MVHKPDKQPRLPPRKTAVNDTRGSFKTFRKKGINSSLISNYHKGGKNHQLYN